MSKASQPTGNPGWQKRRPQRSRKRWVWVTALVALVAGMGIFAAPKLKRAYDRRSGASAVKRATEALAKGDMEQAMLNARVALKGNPQDAEANRVVALALEAAGSPAAVEWRRRLGSMRPDDTENLIAWSRSSLTAGYPDTATDVLGRVKPEDRNSAEYHDIAARLAITRHDEAEAERHWKVASRLDPKTERYRLNLAVLQRKTGEGATREQAMDALRQLAADPDNGRAAQRAILADASARGDGDRAKAAAESLASGPKATFQDRLTLLTVVRSMQGPESSRMMVELLTAARAKPEDLYQLLSWMNGHDLALMVLDWLRELPPDTIAKPPVCMAIAEARVRAMDWEKLQIATEAGTWGAYEFARHAYEARALQGLYYPAESEKAWQTAVSVTEGRPERLDALAKLAFEWKWEDRGTELLWKMTSSGSGSRKVLDTLWTGAARRGNTEQMRTISKMRMNADPRSVEARNNFAFLSLLTRSTEGGIHEIADALYKETPDNPEVIATYAFSLYQRGKTDEALGAMKTLQPEQLRQPGVARYYALFLTANGQGADATEFFTLGEQGFVLPEEKNLLDHAKAKASPAPAAKPQ